jgi:photosystem II stability/assembly factor-like uncharacterized protein
MHWVLVDSHGTSLDSFSDQRAAVHAYATLIHEDAAAGDDVALLQCDDGGIATARIMAAEALAQDSHEARISY